MRAQVGPWASAAFKLRRISPLRDLGLARPGTVEQESDYGQKGTLDTSNPFEGYMQEAALQLVRREFVEELQELATRSGPE
jgi:hypothetical protein